MDNTKHRVVIILDNSKVISHRADENTQALIIQYAHLRQGKTEYNKKCLRGYEDLIPDWLMEKFDENS